MLYVFLFLWLDLIPQLAVYFTFETRSHCSAVPNGSQSLSFPELLHRLHSIWVPCISTRRSLRMRRGCLLVVQISRWESLTHYSHTLQFSHPPINSFYFVNLFLETIDRDTCSLVTAHRTQHCDQYSITQNYQQLGSGSEPCCYSVSSSVMYCTPLSPNAEKRVFLSIPDSTGVTKYPIMFRGNIGKQCTAQKSYYYTRVFFVHLSSVSQVVLLLHWQGEVAGLLWCVLWPPWLHHPWQAVSGRAVTKLCRFQPQGKCLYSTYNIDEQLCKVYLICSMVEQKVPMPLFWREDIHLYNVHVHVCSDSKIGENLLQPLKHTECANQFWFWIWGVVYLQWMLSGCWIVESHWAA